MFASRAGWIASLALGVTILTGEGCEGCHLDPDLIDPPGETLVYLYVRTAPMQGLEAVKLNVLEIRAVVSDSPEGPEREVTLSTPAAEVDLLQFGFEVPLLTWVGSVPGRYLHQLRFITSDDTIDLRVPAEDLHTTVVENCTLKVPSGEQTGIKIIGARGPLDLSSANPTRLLVELDPEAQTQLNQGQGCIFKPVLRASLFQRRALQDYLTNAQTLVSLQVTRLPTLGRAIEMAKVYDDSTRDVFALSVDEQGNLVDANELVREEIQAYRARWGALSPELREHLVGTDFETPIVVGLVHRVGVVPEFDPSGGVEDQRRREHQEQVRSLVETGRSMLLARLGGMADVEILDLDDYAPLLSLRVPAGILQQQIAFDPDVVGLMPEGPPARVLVHDGSVDLAEEPVWARGLQGRGVVVVIHEACEVTGGMVRFDHPAFALMHGKEASVDCPGYSTHATCIAGAVGVGDPEEYAGAPAVTLYHRTDRGDPVSYAPSTWSLPHVVNLSTTESAALRQYVEWYSAKQGVLFTKAAGNDASQPVDCQAYNYLCVGGYNHRDSLWSPGEASAFPDDLPVGSYLNPSSNREVPDLLAPDTVKCPNSSGAYSGQSGTSFSAPMMAGLAALLMEASPDLMLRPAAMKAVLMASAYHNVDGFFVTRPGVDPDGRDGAGVPRADRALGILDEASWTDRFIDETDFDADGYLLNAPSFYAEAYDIVRVALVWESCPAALHSGQQFSLTADLDLILEGPSELPEPEARKVSAAPLFDNRELIQTLVSHGGEYRLRIKSNRLEPCETSAHRARMGIAWAHVPFVDEYLTPPP